MRPQIAVPGILGGLGPLAHIELERRLVEESVRRGASADADHPVWIVFNATDVPDRTRSLQRRVGWCAPWLVTYGNRLSDAGADFIVVPCHTAHAFHAEVSARLRAPWLHLVDRTASAVVRDHPTARRIGVLATDGTLASGVYHRSFAAHGVDVVTPDGVHQVDVMRAIYDPTWGIKSGRSDPRARAALDHAARHLVERGAAVVIAACTELSVALRDADTLSGQPLVDPLQILATVVLDRAFGLTDATGVSP